MATSYDMTITQGSSLAIRLTARDSAGSPINLSGYSVRGYVKKRYSDTGIMLDLAPTIYNSASGIIDISISGGIIAALPVTQAVYDLEVYNSAGYVLKFLKGYFNVEPEATY